MLPNTGCTSGCGSPCGTSSCGSLNNIWPSLGSSNWATSSLSGYNQLPAYTSNSLPTFGGLQLTSPQFSSASNLPTQYDSSALQNTYSFGNTGSTLNLPATQYDTNSLQSYASGFSSHNLNLPTQYDSSLLSLYSQAPQTTSQVLSLPSQSVVGSHDLQATNFQAYSQPSTYQSSDFNQLSSYGQSLPLQSILPSQANTLSYLDTSHLGTSSNIQDMNQHLSYAPGYTWSTSSSHSSLPSVDRPLTYSQSYTQNADNSWNTHVSRNNLFGVVPPKPSPG